ERATGGTGGDGAAERAARPAASRALPLVERSRPPPGQAAPALAVVMADGGRLQILERSPAAGAPPPAEPQPAAAAADPGWDEEPPAAGHWREDKMALLGAMRRERAPADPRPDLPAGGFDGGPTPTPPPH